jgi:Tol biopolymer transport system component
MAQRIKRSIVVGLGIAFAIVARPAAQHQAEVTLRAAREAETVAGDLKKAAVLYEQAVAEAGAKGPVAAQALVGLGMTYQKLGRSDAAAVLVRVVREFADQPGAVAAARAGLGGASARSASVQASAPRLAMDGNAARIFDVSADGRFTVGPQLAAGGWNDIVVREIATGQATVVAPGSREANGFQARVSDSGDFVVYNWGDQQQTVSLRVISTAPAASPRTILSGRDIRTSPLDWMPDGNEILAIVSPMSTDPASDTLMAFDVATGASRTIKTLEPWRQPNLDASVSPDGSTVAYTAVAGQGSSDRYIYTVSARGGSEVAAVRMAGTNSSPVWTPGGDFLLFLNERTGQRDLRAVPMRGGEPAGESFLVHRHFVGTSLFLTRAGTLMYPVSSESGFSEFVAERNPAGSRIVETFKGQSGTWSRGNRLAFIRRGGTGVADLIVRAMDTGEERTYLREGGISVQSSRWLHDDSGLIVFRNEQLEPGTGGVFYRVDVASGEWTRLFTKNSTDYVRSQGVLVAPDNKSIYMAVRKNEKSPWTGIVSVDLQTGSETGLFTFPTPGFSHAVAPCWALSPDGTRLAISVPVEGSTTRSRLITVNVDGSDWREIHTYDHRHWVDILRWTPDGQSLLFIAQPAGATTWRMMRIPATGGAAEFDGLDSAAFTSAVPLPKIETRNIANFEVSPDGTRVVFGSRTIAMHELWSLDNVWSLVEQASR